MNTKQIEALKLALEALEYWQVRDKHSRVTSIAITAIREALAEQPAPPLECKTDAEKTAFAFGWWKALEENRKQPAQDREPAYQYLLEQNRQLTAELAKFRAVSAQALEALEEINRRSVSREHAQLISENAITDLRERLAQPEQEPFCYHDGRDIVGKEYADHSDVFPLYTSPNPEQQKPVRFNCTVIDDAHLNGVPLSQWGKQHEMQPCAGRNCGSTNPNLHSAECFEDYEKATGMVSQQPGIEELEHENRLMRARNERLEAEVDRLERENFAWRTKLGVRGYEMQIEDLRAKLQGLLHYRSKP